jgi:Putative methyltransferase
MDWHKWHNAYDEKPALKKRLVLVRKHLSRCLDRSAPGEVRIISVCAGDGRDILRTLADHKRLADARARLVELDPNLVAEGENACKALQLSGHVEFVNGDATDPSSYRIVAPANIVVMCGMLGLVDLPELPNVVRAMQALCAHKGHVVWTRRLDGRNGVGQTKVLQALMAEAGFRRATLSVTSFGALLSKTARPSFAVGTHQYDGKPVALPESGCLFTISDPFVAQ